MWSARQKFLLIICEKIKALADINARSRFYAREYSASLRATELRSGGRTT